MLFDDSIMFVVASLVFLQVASVISVFYSVFFFIHHKIQDFTYAINSPLHVVLAVCLGYQ